MKKSAWLIVDQKVGNANQAIAIAKAMGVNYEIKTLEYNFLARLPNWLKFDSLIGINSSTSSSLEAPYPDLIISSGRKTAVASNYIKKHNPQTFTVHLMHPDLPFNNFDIVCLPLHDKCRQYDDYTNIFYTIGAPCYLDVDKIKEEGKILSSKLSKLKSPFVSLLIGGATKKGDYTEPQLQWLIKKASELTANINGSLLITTSRRTDPEIAEQLAKHINVPHFCYDWHQSQAKENPYSGFLALSDYFIVTGDSISICSEALCTSKPVYIYRNDNLLYPKHIKFLDYLEELDYTKILQETTLKLETWNYKPLQEAMKVAKVIEEKMKNVNINIPS